MSSPHRSPMDGFAADRSPDSLLTDPQFLVHADPTRVLSLSAHLVSESARRAATIYRTSIGWHRDSDPLTRAQILSVDAARWGATDLAAQLAAAAGSEAPAWQVAWASGSLLDSALLWSADTTAPANRMGHTQVYSVAAATVDDRPVVVAIRADHTLLCWDLAVGTRVGQPDPNHPFRQLSTPMLDGEPAAIVAGMVIINELTAHGIAMIDPVTGRHLGEPIGTGHSVTGLARATLDGQPVAVTAGKDGTLRIWDLIDGGQVGQPLTGHPERITAVATTELDGRPIAVTSGSYGDDTIRVWDLASGQQIGKPFTTGEKVEALAVTHLDGRPVVVTGAPVAPTELWDLTTGERVRQLLSHKASIAQGKRSMVVTELHGRPVVVAGGRDNLVRVVDLATGDQLGEPLTGHRGQLGVNAVAVADLDGRPVAITGSWDSTVRVWDLAALGQAGKPTNRLPGAVSGMAAADVNNRPVIVTSTYDHRNSTARVSVSDMSDGQPVTPPFTTDTDAGRGLGAAAVMAVADLDGRPVAVTNRFDGWQSWELTNGQLLGKDHPPRHLDIAGGIVTAIATGEWDGRPVVVTGHHHDDAHAWALADGQRISGVKGKKSEYATIDAAAITTLRGRPVAITTGGDGDLTVRVWWLTSGRRVCQPDTGHTGPINAIATTELDGSAIAITGSRDHTARIWDVGTGQPVREPLIGHTGSVNAVTTTTLDGHPVVITGSADRTVRFWDLNSAKQLDQITFPHAVHALTVTPDGRLAVGFGWDIAVLVRPTGQG